jgi:hypothetical protein
VIEQDDKGGPAGSALLWFAVALGLGWLALVGLLILFMPPPVAPIQGMTRLLQIAAALFPLGLIWGGFQKLRQARDLRAEAQELRATLASLRRPAPPPRRDAAAAMGPSIRFGPGAADGTAGEDAEAGGQGALDLPPPGTTEPLPVATLIAALNFPRDAQDRDGFRALERALADPATARVIRAAEDVLTLLAQDGVYAEDLDIRAASPDLWRRFAAGERVAGLDRLIADDLVRATAERLRADAVFRDAGHHFLRHFDALMEEIAPRAEDEVIRLLVEPRAALGEDALQRAAMHVQAPRRFAHVAVAQLVDPLDMLPPDAVGRHRVFRRRRHLLLLGEKGGGDVVGVGGFRQVVRRADLDRGHGRRDGAVTGQDDDPAIGAFLAQGFDHVETVAILEPQVDHRIGRGARRRDGLARRDGTCRLDREAALFHGPLEPAQERFVIIDQQQRLVLADVP